MLHGATARCSDPYKNKKYIQKRCRIAQVPKNIPREATELNLSYNKIKDIPSGAFKNLPNCTELNLSSNKIKDIPSGAFKNLPNCTELNMGKNRLTHIRTLIFDGLSSLEDLDLCSNQISDIDPGSFYPLQQCTNLWLPNNQLTCLRAETFKGLVSLNLLDLYSNQISFIEDGTFSHLPLIRVLYLNKNDLVTPMDEKDLILSQNPFLFLDENPLQCDTRMCWIKDAERDGRVKLRKLRGRWDHTPQCMNYKGVHWNNITLPCNVSGKWNNIGDFLNRAELSLN